MGVMETIHSLTAPLLIFMVLAGLLFKLFQGTPKKIKLPPGPRPLPIVGNLHMLGKLPHRELRELSQTHGSLMFLRLGCVPTVVASSPETAKQIMRSQDLVFASRPSTAAATHLFYNSTDIAFAPYGHYWRQMRRVSMLALLNPKQVESFQFVRAQEVSVMVNSILQDGCRGLTPVNVSKAVSTLTSDIICRMTFGQKYAADGADGGRFRAAIKEFLLLLGAFDVGDFVPWLRWMDLQGLRRRQRKVRETFDAILGKIIEEHEARNDAPRDLVDALLAMSREGDLQMEVTCDNIKAVVLDMLSAGTDTVAGVLEWGMSLLLKNPSAMEKAQEELERVIGLKRMVQESDLPGLDYLRAVVKETLRLYPPGPLLVPRETVETCIVSGYEIPARTRVIVNAWAIGRDSKWWEDAERFEPKRFIGGRAEGKGQNFEMIPFGSGRRECPGMQLGIAVAELALAQLLHCFQWKLPHGMNVDDLDMREEFGLSMPRAVNLLAVAIPRLHIDSPTNL